MFKIGDFSKLSQVPVKTLRYYDEIGLLKPAKVDRFTSYRQYSADQLPRLNRILALKDLGLSLAQIAQLLDGDLPPEQIRVVHFATIQYQRQQRHQPPGHGAVALDEVARHPAYPGTVLILGCPHGDQGVGLGHVVDQAHDRKGEQEVPGELLDAG